MANIGDRKMFGLVYETATGQPRRLIDTSDDKDDSHLLEAQKVVADDESMVMLAIEDYPERRPIIIAQQLGLIPVPKPPADPVPSVAVALTKAIAATDFSTTFKRALFVRVKAVLATGKLPRFDTAVRALVAAELKRLGRAAAADQVTNDDDDAPNHVAAIVANLWAERDA